MSVVGSDFDKLKRYNIEELRQGPAEGASDATAQAPAPAPAPAVSVKST
jgi:hypothetical protein